MSKKRGTCSKCGREDLALMARGLCATCYAKQLKFERANAGPPADPEVAIPGIAPGPLAVLVAELVTMIEKTLHAAEDAVAAGEQIAEAIKPLRLRYIKLRDDQATLTQKAREVTVTISDNDGKED